jgi:hypothetical protein
LRKDIPDPEELNIQFADDRNMGWKKMQYTTETKFEMILMGYV